MVSIPIPNINWLASGKESYISSSKKHGVLVTDQVGDWDFISQKRTEQAIFLETHHIIIKQQTHKHHLNINSNFITKKHHCKSIQTKEKHYQKYHTQKQ